jgi:aerobic-type carbon monoxide dehydrogenase small subunit (CoxS/CutS family)
MAPEHALSLDPRISLLDTLREQLNLTGSKKGLRSRQCGACTVLVNGRRINSCLSLAVMHEGDEITTIEGLAQGDQLHPVQQAFIEQDGFQCGYCTPGQICSAVACIKEGHSEKRRRDPRVDERQSLPLRRLPEHRRSDQGSSGKGRMNSVHLLARVGRTAGDQRGRRQPEAQVLGGGTNLVDLMKMGVERPTQLVDINRLPLTQIEELPEAPACGLAASRGTPTSPSTR